MQTATVNNMPICDFSNVMELCKTQFDQTSGYSGIVIETDKNCCHYIFLKNKMS